MKFRFLLPIFILFLSSYAQAQEGLSHYLIFQPQEIERHQELPGISVEQAKDLDKLLKESIKDLSAGKWLLILNGKTLTITFQIDARLDGHDAYTLDLGETDVQLIAKNLRALQYGKQSLSQILNYALTESVGLPKIEIQDWANFERRGYMLDISRDKIPTMESLYALIDQLAFLRINELQLYTEHTFAYRNHQVVWENASPLTAEEVRSLDRYCVERGIDLVPNQNSFGHMENWLKHDEYLTLSECETDCNTIWGKRKRTALAPTEPKSLELMQELYAELLPNFSSKYANIGGDETVELGLGKSKKLSDEIGKGKVYLDFLIQLNEEVQKNGKQTQFWGDIVLNHPELIKDIPKNMTAMVWGYESNYPFDKNLPKFQEAGLDFYVCPGTSSWRSEIGRNHDAFLNLKNAASNGLKYGAKGYLITDWGDYGHFQPKSVSYAPLLLGASYAWNQTDKTLDNLPFLLNQYIFKDPTGNSAKAALTLGDAYLKAKLPEGNANAFHLMIRRFAWTMDGHFQTKHLTKSNLTEAKKEIEKGLELLKKAEPSSYDAEIIKQELEQAALLAKFGANLGLARLNTKNKSTKEIPASVKQELVKELAPLIESHQSIWVVRNREGGLQDSAEKLRDLLEYLGS